MSDTDVFTPHVVAAVTTHLNEDHAEHCRDIVRVLGGVEVERVTAASVDADGIEFVAHHGSGRDEVVRVPWSVPIGTRADIRAEVVRMYEQTL